MCLKPVSMHLSKRQRYLSRRRCYSAVTHLRFQQHDLDKLFLREVDFPVYFRPYLGLVFGLSGKLSGRWCTLVIPAPSPPMAPLLVGWREVFCRLDGWGSSSGTECSGAVAFSQAEHQGQVRMCCSVFTVGRGSLG